MYPAKSFCGTLTLDSSEKCILQALKNDQDGYQSATAAENVASVLRMSRPALHSRMMDLASTSSDSSHSRQRHSADDSRQHYSTDDSRPLNSAEVSRKRDTSDEAHQPAVISKRQRLTWTGELHARFLAAVKTLGVSNAVPQKILRLMNVKGLTRDQVASHLQKYRLQLKRLTGLSDDACLDVDTIAALQQTQDGLLSPSNTAAASAFPEATLPHRAHRVSPFAMPEQDIQARLCVALHSSKNESSEGDAAEVGSMLDDDIQARLYSALLALKNSSTEDSPAADSVPEETKPTLRFAFPPSDSLSDCDATATRTLPDVLRTKPFVRQVSTRDHADCDAPTIHINQTDMKARARLTRPSSNHELASSDVCEMSSSPTYSRPRLSLAGHASKNDLAGYHLTHTEAMSLDAKPRLNFSRPASRNDQSSAAATKPWLSFAQNASQCDLANYDLSAIHMSTTNSNPRSKYAQQPSFKQNSDADALDFQSLSQDIKAKLQVALQSARSESPAVEASRVREHAAWSPQDNSFLASGRDDDEETGEPVVNFLPVPTPQGLLLIPLSMG